MNATSIRPIKSLGQSFLTHEKTADKLIDALELQSDDRILEIGAGKGILTSRLIKKANLVIAIEIDARLVNYLKGKFSQIDNLKIVECDFLHFDLKPHRGLKIVGNLPYYISTSILWKLLENYECWEIGVFTTQREFAHRVLAYSGSSDYCPLSVLSEYHFERRRLFDIPAAHFKPRPKVSSTAFTLKKRSGAFSIENYEQFVSVVLGAFSPNPRKLLINNLAHSFQLSRMELIRILQELNLPLNTRPGDVNLQEFIELSNILAAFIK